MYKSLPQYELENLEELVTGLKSADKAEVKKAFKRARDVYGFDTNGITLKQAFYSISLQAKLMADAVDDYILAIRRKERVQILGLYRAICRGNVVLIKQYLQSFNYSVKDDAVHKRDLVRDAHNFLRTYKFDADLASETITSADIDRLDTIIQNQHPVV
jgi:hypothetical protein